MRLKFCSIMHEVLSIIIYRFCHAHWASQIQPSLVIMVLSLCTCTQSSSPILHNLSWSGSWSCFPIPTKPTIHSRLICHDNRVVLIRSDSAGRYCGNGAGCFDIGDMTIIITAKIFSMDSQNNSFPPFKSTLIKSVESVDPHHGRHTRIAPPHIFACLFILPQHLATWSNQ